MVVLLIVIHNHGWDTAQRDNAVQLSTTAECVWVNLAHDRWNHNFFKLVAPSQFAIVDEWHVLWQRQFLELCGGKACSPRNTSDAGKLISAS